MEKGEKRIPELVQTAARLGIRVNSVLLRKPSLEDVFLQYTGRTIRDEDSTQAERPKGRGRRSR